MGTKPINPKPLNPKPKKDLFIFSFGDQMGLFNWPYITKKIRTLDIPKIEQLYSYALYGFKMSKKEWHKV
jgi:hypothetical protein